MNIPGKVLNVNKIHRTNDFFPKKKTTIGHIRVIHLFPSCEKD